MASEPVYTLFDLITSHRVTAAIYVTAKLGLRMRSPRARRPPPNSHVVQRRMNRPFVGSCAPLNDRRLPFRWRPLHSHRGGRKPFRIRSALAEGLGDL